MENNIQNILPPQHVFEDDGLFVGSETSNPHKDPSQNPIAIGVEFPMEGGLLLHYDNLRYPRKGWVFKAAILSIDSIKRSVICLARFVVSLPKSIVTFKVVDSVIEQFSDFTEKIIRGHGAYWKQQYYCTMVREVWDVAMSMADKEYEKNFVKGICTVLEFDDVWRYFIQDAMGIINLVAFDKNPRKELKRVFSIIMGRSEGAREKFEKMGKLLGILLYIPKVKRTLKIFLSLVDIENLKLDTADSYTCLMNFWHDFGGVSLGKRLVERNRLDIEWIAQGKEHYDSEGKPIKIPEPTENAIINP